MIEILSIFLLYAIQGSIQGLVFGTLPVLLRRNPAATDLHQSEFSFVGYPFSLKFLIAPLVDGIYSARIGRRESWLLPLQLISAVGLAWLSVNVDEMLNSDPPQVTILTLLLFGLVAATAAGDIATDAWAATRMSDSRASLCQAVGLSFGSQLAGTLFFVLLGRGWISLPSLLRAMSTAGFVVLGFFALQMLRRGAPKDGEEEDEDHVTVWDVLVRISKMLRQAPNFRWWLLFLLLIPIRRGHSSMVDVRYQKLGFIPELFADYKVLLLPLTFVNMWLGGKVSQTKKIFTVYSWLVAGQILVSALVMLHFWRCQAVGEAAVSDPSLKWSYMALGQLANSVGVVEFVVKGAIYNRIAACDHAMAGTIITFLASVGNLGGLMPGTWAPLMTDRYGLDATALFCQATGLLVLLGFWRFLRRIEDLEGPGWGRSAVKKGDAAPTREKDAASPAQKDENPTAEKAPEQKKSD